MKLQILVLGAELADCRLLGRLLRATPDQTDNIRLRFAATMDEAIPIRIRPPPDLILLQQSVPDDEDATALLAATYPGAPIVLLVAAFAPLEYLPPLGTSAATRVVLAAATPQRLRELLIHAILAARNAEQPPLGPGTGDIVLNAITDAVLSSDAAGRVRYANPAAVRLLCQSAEQLLGTPVSAAMRLHAPVSGAPIPHPVEQVLATGHAQRLEGGAILMRADGTHIIIDDSCGPIFDAHGAVDGAVMVFHDITAAHQLQTQVNYLAWHDFLTGLPNRCAAQQHLSRILVEAKARGTALAVMYLDLDKFKVINDTLGHAAGDELLVAVARRLRACFREQDLISRQGGDEFVVLMAPGTARLDASNAAMRIRNAMTRPHQINGVPAHIGCSIGIALYPEHGDTEQDLLRHADTALHSAKAAGPDNWRFFNQGMVTSAVLRRQLEDGLRQGLLEQQFELYYQPKVRLSDGALCGCEALLRWRHPNWDWVATGHFIRVAEESGFIIQLGRWALNAAIRQARLWELADLMPGPIAVNVSALEMEQPDFADYIERHIGNVGVAPGLLQLELTESALMRDMDVTQAVMLRIKDIGLSLAIDDFGTGYSSLSYLAELPIDLLKVDRAFVHGIDHASERKRTLLRAILELADNLALPAVAEGIETEREVDFLSASGCVLGQGFFYSPALDASAFENAYLRQRTDVLGRTPIAAN